ncbi:MAG: PHP domain-containing protein [Oligoflexia bacterium]|nr:PHP domain-containing protein [Oligoflexia bacterium]
MNQNNKFDLHLHSGCSNDGEFSVNELLQMANSQDYDYIAVCDHNTIAGVSAFLSLPPIALKTRLIPGIEIDCAYQGKHLHILGLGIKPERVVERNLFANHTKQESEQEKIRLLDLFRRARAKGLLFDDDRVWMLAGVSGASGAQRIPCIEVLAAALLEDPRNNDHPLLAPYRPRGPRSGMPEFYFYLDHGKKDGFLVTKREYQDASWAIKTIHASGGKAILAHPGGYHYFSPELLESLMNEGLEGLEVLSSYHDLAMSKDYFQLAKERKIFVSGGSDFHGRWKPTVKMGIEGASTSISTGTSTSKSAWLSQVLDDIFKLVKSL